MGLFSRPKCPIHRVEYSIGTDGLTNHYYCKICRQEAIYEHDEKLSKDREISDLKRRLEALEEKNSYPLCAVGFINTALNYKYIHICLH